MPPSSRRLVASLLAALATVPVAARAEVPAARLALGVGGRVNLGSLGNDFRWGWQIVHVEAALQPFDFGTSSRFRAGIGWWATISRYTATATTAIDVQIAFLQMGVGPRFEYTLPLEDFPLSVHAQLGYEFMRTSHPVPPGDDDTYHLLAVQGGFGFGATSQYCLTFRVEPLPSAPTGVYGFLEYSFGSL